MNREQEIRKIAQSVCGWDCPCCDSADESNCRWIECTIALYNAGYRNADELIAKIKQLEEENYELRQHLGQCENGYEQTLFLERCKAKDIEDKVRAKTAREIAEFCKHNRAVNANYSSIGWNCAMDEILDYIFKQYGVEVEE